MLPSVFTTYLVSLLPTYLTWHIAAFLPTGEERKGGERERRREEREEREEEREEERGGERGRREEKERRKRGEREEKERRKGERGEARRGEVYGKLKISRGSAAKSVWGEIPTANNNCGSLSLLSKRDLT